MRGQDLPPGPKREPGRKVIPPLGRQCWGGGSGQPSVPTAACFLGPVREQVQLPGVAGAWVRASAVECCRALPLPAGMSTCPSPRAAVVLVATAPSAAAWLPAGCPGPLAGEAVPLEEGRARRLLGLG